ncbi:protein kinase [Streptomyces vastus]|uniref:protein kinase n=1 Tax=Streptomyces vastus TaxID=285451 RepID=UPI0031D0BFA1
MDDYAGRVLADRYRLPLPPSDEYEFAESRAFDTYSGQEVLVRQVPLPEVVEAEVIDADGLPDGFVARDGGARRSAARPTRRPTEPAVRRAIEAAQAAAQIPDHPRLDQVFDVFAEGGSLWIVSELVPARPLAALLADRPLTPYRAAEVAADVLTALRVLHAHGWVHRNITVRTVLVCDDGRVMLTGLAAGAAEEALCGYDPVPVAEGERAGGPEGADSDSGSASGTAAGSPVPHGEPGQPGQPGHHGSPAVPHTRFPGDDRSAVEAAPGDHGAVAPVAQPPVAGRRALEPSNDVRAARAGAIAAYRAGARAAARVHEEQRDGRHGQNAALPAPRPRPAESDTEAGQTSAYGVEHTAPPGQIADPYGVGGSNPWHGAVPRAGAPALPGNGQGPGQPALPGQANVTGTGTGIPGNGFGASGTGTDVPGNGAAPEASGVPTGSPDYRTDPHAPHAHAPDPHAPDQHTSSGPTRWPHLVPERAPHRGPTTALAAERARQARMAVVGPVTERWAPEQAGPVHENWQLAAPIGPSTDLWALGALLFRAVQGHAPYPEENTAELVQLVCAEPPAFAEECGPLRPVVESLLRQDPTERLDFEELRGWLRSLVRSAPEPEAGTHVVVVPPVDATRLPVVRRRGELVRKRRAGLPDRHARHKRQEKAPKPRRLGRTLLVLILLALAAAVAYAMVFMPKAEPDASGGAQTGAAGDAAPEASSDTDPNPGTDGNAGTDPQPDETPSATPSKENSPSQSSSSDTQTTGPDLPQDFTLRKDSEGFSVAVARGWDRTPKNGSGQVVYSQGNFELLIVPGRDTASQYGDDPMTYQREEERELQRFRDSTWATSSGMRRIDVGGRAMAEGQFTWQDAEGREIYVRNLAILVDGRYHVVQLRGPEAERDEVSRLYEQASATYRITG